VDILEGTGRKHKRLNRADDVFDAIQKILEY